MDRRYVEMEGRMRSQGRGTGWGIRAGRMRRREKGKIRSQGTKRKGGGATDKEGRIKKEVFKSIFFA